MVTSLPDSPVLEGGPTTSPAPCPGTTRTPSISTVKVSPGVVITSQGASLIVAQLAVLLLFILWGLCISRSLGGGTSPLGWGDSAAWVAIFLPPRHPYNISFFFSLCQEILNFWMIFLVQIVPPYLFLYFLNMQYSLAGQS
jgi:hypothetical protein